MNRNNLLKAVFGVVALILVLVILYSGLQILESTVLYSQKDETAPETKWIVRDDVRYFPRQDIVVVMLLGVDRPGTITGTEADSGFAADLITLMIFDEKEQTSSLLLLNRDAMVMMPSLDEHGKETGKYYLQLALSHTFGTGREDSCENTRKTVSDLLYGITIDHYVSMNLDGIEILNDLVGGVTVNVTDDFSAIDPTIGMGQVTLRGEQAVHFVRTRKGLGDQLNLSRIERHKAYFNGFMDAFQAKLEEGSGFILSAYEEISPYLVTDCSANVITSMMERYGEYELQQIVSIAGENTRGKKYMEFIIDEEKLDQQILDLFYAPKE